VAGLPERNGDFRVSENELEGTKKKAEKKTQTQTTSLARAPTLLSLVFLFRTLLDPSLGGFPRAGSKSVSKRVSRSPSRLERQGEESSRREQGRVYFFFEKRGRKKEETLVLLASTLASLLFSLSTFDSSLLLSFFIFPNDTRLEPASSPPPSYPSPPFARS